MAADADPSGGIGISMSERCALITGASRGIGAEIARRLAVEGYALTLSARSEPGLLIAAEQLRTDTGAEVHAVAANMAVEDDVRRLCSEHEARFGRLDLLVLNAGVGTSGPIAELSVKAYDLTLAVNLRAAFILLQETLPLLRKTAALEPERGAKVVALASIAGVSGEANLGAYAASKAALISLCQTVTLEESGNGVTATALCPGLVATDMTAWTRVPAEQMLPASDIAELAVAVSRLSVGAVVPNIVIARRGSQLTI
jgi:3-oxoacyl-[acyl-carrier protein] reductase